MRPATVKDYEKIQAGGEPVWPKGTSQSLAGALNWYNSFSDYKESKKYAIHYLKERKSPKEVVEAFEAIPENKFLNVGFVCRMYMRGAPIPLHRIQKELIALAKIGIPSSRIVTLDGPKVNPQERLQERCRELVGELEGELDECLVSRDFTKLNPYEWMQSNEIKQAHTRYILQWAHKRFIEIQMVLTAKNPFIAEGYSNLDKPHWKAYEKLVQLIISDCERIAQVAKVIRQMKPRKKKEKPVEKILANVQYKKSDQEYKLVSVDPRDILGSTQLWVFNTKTRKLGVYHSATTAGFSVKGTTLMNVNPAVQKILRKPEEVLPKVLKSTKPELKKLMHGIGTSESELSGRLNDDTIILRVLK